MDKPRIKQIKSNPDQWRCLNWAVNIVGFGNTPEIAYKDYTITLQRYRSLNGWFNLE